MSATTEGKSGVKTATIIKWVCSIAVPLAIMAIPTTEAYTPVIRNFLAATIFMIAMIATELVPMPAIALALPIMYIVFFKVPSNVVFAPWTIEIPWLILCGFLFSAILVKTGLMKRLAYQCIIGMGGKFAGIVWGMLILGALISLLISDVAAKAVLLGTLALGMCKVLNLELGTKDSSAIGLCAYLSMLNPGFFFFSGTMNNLVPMGIVEGMGLETPSWGGYFIQMFPPQLVYTILCGLALQLFFKPDKPIETKDYLRSELHKMGPISKDEKKITLIAVLLVVALIFNSLHGIAIGWLFVMAIVIMLLPGVNLLKGEDFKSINLPLIIFVASCLGIGVVSGYFKVGAFLADVAYPLIQGSLARSFAGVWTFGFVTNFILTPLAAYSAFTEPIASMAVKMGINHLPLVYCFTQSMEQIILPYEFAPVLFLYGYGMITFKRMVAYSAVKSILSLLCILFVYMTWWKIIGLL